MLLLRNASGISQSYCDIYRYNIDAIMTTNLNQYTYRDFIDAIMVIKILESGMFH